jgi:hypothetical protein
MIKILQENSTGSSDRTIEILYSHHTHTHTHTHVYIETR